MSASVGVVGCGYWGKNLVRNFSHLNALHSICDVDPIALTLTHSMYPDVRPTSDFRDLLSSEGPDALVIASPAALHHEQALAALESRKDVFVEKPLALEYRHGVELVEKARRYGRVLMVGHVLEYHPAVEALKTLVRSGELGTLRYIYSNRLNLGKIRREENILWSFAPHDISIITSLVGEAPISVAASGGSYLQEGIVDVTVTNLVFHDGVRAHIFVSWLHPHKEQRLTVIGDAKMATFDDTLTEGKLRIIDKGIEWDGDLPVSWTGTDEVPFVDSIEALRRECAHFLHCVNTRQEPLTGGENALLVLKVLQAAQSSLDNGGQPVELSKIEEGIAVG